MQDTENTSLSAKTDELRALVERVASSPLLKRAPRLQELFLYLVEHSIQGTAGNLREQTIGEDVFGRASGYDTGADNIVRVSVFQLRKKIDQYFAEVGDREQVVITIPKGRYVVEFLPRTISEEPPVAESPAPLPETPPLPTAAENRPKPRPARRWALVAAACLALAIAGAAVWIPVVRQAAKPLPGSPAHHRLWANVFRPNSNAYIVVGDVGFSLVQDVSGVTLGLDDYMSGPSRETKALMGSVPPELSSRLMERQYTSVSNSAVTFRLGAINQALGGRGVIRSARSIDVRDLKSHNVVLLGSSRSNPWVSLLKDRMSFQVDYETVPSRGFIRNTRPREGEPDVFRATAMAGKPGEAFGLIAYLPNLDETGTIISIGGTNMEGTEAAAETLLNERLFNALVKQLRVDDGAPIPHFEAVIRSTSVGGAGSSPEIVAVRIQDQKPSNQ